MDEHQETDNGKEDSWIANPLLYQVQDKEGGKELREELLHQFLSKHNVSDEMRYALSVKVFALDGRLYPPLDR